MKKQPLTLRIKLLLSYRDDWRIISQSPFGLTFTMALYNNTDILFKTTKVKEAWKVFEEICDLLRELGIQTKGFFLNTDAGFNSQELRQHCLAMKMKANIELNLRNSEALEEYVYFDK